MAAAASTLSSFHSLGKRSTLEPLPTGVAALDRLVGGGIPRASMTEIWGAPSSGRTSLVQTILRTTTAKGQYCVWIDTPDAFDPQTAAAAGVRLSQLLWVRSHRQLDQALQAADLLVRAGGFSLVFLDLSGVPARIASRIPIATWFRLRHGAEHSSTALIVTSEGANTGSCAKLQLGVRQDRILWSHQLLRGAHIVAFSSKRGKPQPVSFLARM